jgi:hypothetical protein
MPRIKYRREIDEDGNVYATQYWDKHRRRRDYHVGYAMGCVKDDDTQEFWEAYINTCIDDSILALFEAKEQKGISPCQQ